MAPTTKDFWTRAGTILGIIVAVGMIAAALGDSRYVTRSEWSDLRADVRVIRAAICQDRPQACQP